MNMRIDCVRPHVNPSGERGFSEQGMYGMDLPDLENDDDVVEDNLFPLLSLVK